jgi:hypothetical protein
VSLVSTPQLDATDEFLLQILLLAEHVSVTIMPIIRSPRVLYKRLLPVASAFQFVSFFPYIFPYSDPRAFIAFLCSINDRRFLSVYWAENGNFNDNDSSEDWCCVVSCKFNILDTRGEQIAGARYDGRLNFVQWYLMLVGSVVGHNFVSPLSCREVWCESQTFGKTLILCKM